jgi:signal transduction histidine kinase
LLVRSDYDRSMLRLPRTVTGALLAGFIAIFALWLASTYYVLAGFAASEAQRAATYARFLRGQELLFAVSNQVLLGSVAVRDALIEGTDQSAGLAHDQLRSLQAQVERELEQYKSIGSVVDAVVWARLEEELRTYWEAPPALLRTRVIPKREAIAQISAEISQLMADDYRQEEKHLNEVHEQLRRRVGGTTAVAVILGCGVVFLATRYAGGLESQVRQHLGEVARNRRDLQRLSARLVRAQEDERRTVARELHDEIGQALTAVKVELAFVERSVHADGQTAGRLSAARAVTEQALTSVRDLSQLLRPAMLDDFGLPDTIKWYVRKFSDRTGIRAEFVGDGLAERLSTDVEVSAYRVLQEGLTNVARHAQATTCRVFVQRLSASLVVTVEDDGRGFHTIGETPASPSTGLGLVGIRERAVQLGGTFRIESGPDKGTRLTVEFPLTIGAQA